MAYPNPKTAKSQPHEARYDNSTAARTHSYFFYTGNQVCGCVSQPEIVSSNAPVLNIVELALTNT